MPKVTFLPECRRIEVESGTTIYEAAREAGLPLVAPCGGRSRCGRCVVELRGEGPPPTKAERDRLSEEDLAAGKRLACELTVDRDLEVLIAPSSRAVFTEILADGECVAFTLDPVVSAQVVELGGPSLEDNAADLSRLGRALDEDDSGGDIQASMDAARALPGVLRENAFRAKVLVRNRRLVKVAPPGDGLRALGAAFDIGTTTVAGALLDLSTGRTLAVASRTNPQHALGDDVVSRMDHAAKGRAPLAELQRLIVECLNDMLGELARKAGSGPQEVFDIVVAGNNVMTHLFLGLPPEAMATVPFVPVVTTAVDVAASEAGLTASPEARVRTMPSASAYVGGDITAGMLAVGFGGLAGEALFIDIGTNGEVVAKGRKGSGERALCAATAAGPAFEGARISCGMRAVPGAITRVRITGGEPCCEVAGDVAPAGVCGTGLVDAVACLLDAGVVDETGRIDTGSAGALSSRIRDGRGGPEFVLSAAGPTEVVLTQRDIRELQLAKAAICAGATALLHELGVGAAELRRVLLAGAFGSTIDPRSAARIGLLPEGVSPGRVRAVGNTAAAGARAVVVSRSAGRQAMRIARWLKPVELALDARFQALFAESMLFPKAGGEPKAGG